MADRAPYDPFLRGAFPVGVRTLQARDGRRDRIFPCEIWYPATRSYAGQDLLPDTQDAYAVPLRDGSRRQAAVRDAAGQPGTYPLIVFSHFSGGHRRSSSFLCTHLSSHGYIVAALDHSETIAPELARYAGETNEQKHSRAQAWIANRIPDVEFLLDHLLEKLPSHWEARIDAQRIGIAGHSFGGWTALAAAQRVERIRAVVALAPGGASNPKPGILKLELSFAQNRTIPTLYLAAENDVSLPLPGMYELFERTPPPKRLIVLRRADHLHFIDDVALEHESVRAMHLPGELEWLPKEMLPIAKLTSGDRAHAFVRGLSLAHLDGALKQHRAARRFLAREVEGSLAARTIDVMAPRT